MNIHINDLKNRLFHIEGSNNIQSSVVYMDPQISSFNSSINLSENTVFLDKYIINDLNIQTVNDLIYSEFFKKISYITKYNEKIYISKYNNYELINKLNYISRKYILEKNRTGPAEWILVNNDTYHYLLNKIKDFELQHYEDNSYIITNNMFLYTNHNIKDGDIVFGKKTTLHEPGVYCIVLIDSKGELYYDDLGNNNYMIYFSIISMGKYPNVSYFTAKRSLKYIRKQKLEQINEKK